MSVERSQGGSRIYRHESPAPAEVVAGDQGLINAVGDHIAKHFGEPDRVLHEIVSPYVHVDLHVVMPTDERPVITVVTSGMSERPMPGGLYAELMLVLPPTWPTQGDPAFETDEGYWPYQLLKTLARLPHEFQTRLWVGDTVPNGDPPQRYARNTKLCGALIAPMVMQQHEAAKVFEYDGRQINLFSVWPLHADEMRVKLDHGLDRLHELLDEARIMEILHADRSSVVPRRRFRFRR
jgi:Suppressor of fused protein (SUFU)